MWIHALQIEEAREKIEELLRKAPRGDRPLVRLVLEKWDDIAEALDKALLNHGYWELTVPLSYRNRAVMVKFERSKKRGAKDWRLVDVWVSGRVNWGYRWEYDLEKDRLISRKRITTAMVT